MNAREFLQSLFSKVAQQLNWGTFEISTDIDYEGANGFLGEFFLASIINSETKEKLDLAVKKSLTLEARRVEFNIQRAFNNEITFYDTIIPTLMQFKDSKNIKEDIDFLPKFYASSRKVREECLVLENLRSSGFNILGRETFIGEELVEFIFKTYGKFHALSFALKDQKPEEYRRITEPLSNSVDYLMKQEHFKNTIIYSFKTAFECVDKNLQNKLKPILDNIYDDFVDAFDYRGKYTCIAHGDSWSNNLMFKFEDKKLIGIKLIDFQIIWDDTPVHDLSYFLYAGASTEAIKNIEKYLEIYHESFSKMCKDLGSDPVKVYPLEALKADWKKYSKWGLGMGLMISRVKMMDENSVQDLFKNEFFKDFTNGKLHENKYEMFEQRMKDIVEDVYEKGYLNKD